MRELNRWQNVVFLLGGLLMVVGAGVSLLQMNVAPYIYGFGALGFATMQMLQQYEGTNMVIRRLRRIVLLSDVLFLLTAVLMFASLGNSFGLSQIDYLQYVYNKWVGTLLLAALLQLYATHRIESELRKEAKKR